MGKPLTVASKLGKTVPAHILGMAPCMEACEGATPNPSLLEFRLRGILLKARINRKQLNVWKKWVLEINDLPIFILVLPLTILPVAPTPEKVAFYKVLEW